MIRSLTRSLPLLGLLALANGCHSERAPRPTILGVPPPTPPPGPDEARLMPVELGPDASEAPETAPGTSLESMSRRALDGAQSSILACYETLLLQHSRAEGSVEVQLDLSPAGDVTRTHLDHQRDRDLDDMLPCLRQAFADVHVREVSPRGRYVSRVYTFHNPPIDRVVHAAVVIAPPPRPVRQRPRRGTPPAPTAPPAPAAPAPAAGSLRAEELTRALADLASLRACAPIALRRARRGEVATTLRMTVQGDGAVAAPALEATPTPSPELARCVTEAVAPLHFRATGITLHARVPVTFRR